MSKWTPKSIENRKKVEKLKTRKSWEMQKMQKVQKPSKSDAPDLERTPKVGKIVSKNDEKVVRALTISYQFFSKFF